MELLKLIELNMFRRYFEVLEKMSFYFKESVLKKFLFLIGSN
jgi:hypothetical protein